MTLDLEQRSEIGKKNCLYRKLSRYLLSKNPACKNVEAQISEKIKTN